MKKGQTEMLGFVVIVILIVIGALLYVRFGVLGGDEGRKTKEDTITSIQGYNLMNAVMNVKICEDVSVREGLVKCRSNEQLCGMDACAYLDEEIDNLVSVATHKDYSFMVNSSGWSYNLGECDYGVASYPYIYNLKGDSYRAVFKLC